MTQIQTKSKDGYFGHFGGRYVPEILRPAFLNWKKLSINTSMILNS